jgi:GTPase
MALIDEAHIRVFSGAGGDGCVSFRREKFIPFGGPNGGDGGRGGDVYIVATRDKHSLLDFRFQPKYEAERGEHGMGSDMFGRGGEDLEIAVPVGTLIYDEETGELIEDLKDDGTKLLIAPGGRGGRGNLSYKSSTNRAPRTAETGKPGVVKNLKLELRLLADVGLIGLPNAGKSSFLQSVSRARPKVADYPFTTLEPHLGVVDHKEQSFIVADLPGLIEGASSGAGLGHRFLKHVARNRVLLHLVEVTHTPAEIEKNVQVIREEIRAYDAELLKREEFLVFTKVDLLTEAALKKKKDALEKRGLKGFFISSKTRQGLEGLLDLLSEQATRWEEA